MGMVKVNIAAAFRVDKKHTGLAAIIRNEAGDVLLMHFNTEHAHSVLNAEFKVILITLKLA